MPGLTGPKGQSGIKGQTGEHGFSTLGANCQCKYNKWSFLKTNIYVNLYNWGNVLMISFAFTYYLENWDI
jgi:hypothetical protein